MDEDDRKYYLASAVGAGLILASALLLVVGIAISIMMVAIGAQSTFLYEISCVVLAIASIGFALYVK